jgi:hypothetical protein
MVAFVAGTTLAAADLNSAFNELVINAQSGSSYTIAASDAGGLVTLTASSGTATVNVPPNSSVPLDVGTQIGLLAAGGTATTYTVAEGSGVTLESYGSLRTLSGKGALAVLIKTDTDTWYLAGSLVA